LERVTFKAPPDIYNRSFRGWRGGGDNAAVHR